MKPGVDFYEKFARTMMFTAILTGIFIAISLPSTYFILSWTEQKTEADYLSRQIAQKIAQTARINPEFWKFSVVKFMKIFDEIENKEIAAIRIFDEKNILLDQETFQNDALLLRTGEADIVYNNTVFGRVETDKIADSTLLWTVSLLNIFLLLGVVIAVILFRYPAKIIRKAEIDINTNIDQLNHLSYIDPVTNLRNRTYLNELFPTLLEKKEPFALIFLDLDDFKHINDSFGHSCGDILLEQIGVILRSVIRKEDIIIRFGGDEFMVILLHIGERKSVERIAQQFVDSLGKMIIVQNHELFITASMGVVLYPDDGENMQQLIKNADAALYSSKEAGKNQYHLYSSRMNSDSVDRLNFENSLRKALDRDEFQLYFQPKFELRERTVAGCEILIRWRHPELGLLYPDSFIHVAEETGLIIPIGNYIIDRSANLIAEWTKTCQTANRFSINISPLQFQQENLASTILNAIERHGIRPEFIELEITESIAMQHEESVLKKLRTLKDVGIEISVDDFGTGYSTMNYLRKYPIDMIKIAMPFIMGMSEDPGDEAIVSAIVSISHAFGKKVIAEGIETEEQVEKLIRMGCDYGQGFLLCRPLPFDEFVRLTAGTTGRRSEPVA